MGGVLSYINCILTLSDMKKSLKSVDRFVDVNIDRARGEVSDNKSIESQRAFLSGYLTCLSENVNVYENYMKRSLQSLPVKFRNRLENKLDDVLLGFSCVGLSYYSHFPRYDSNNRAG